MTKHIAIAGGGIAGLAAAASFAKLGFDVDVYEQGNNLREIGAGIYVKENTFDVLDELGLSERIESAGVRINAARIVDQDQVIVTSRDVSKERLVVCLRSELHNALRDRAIELGAKIHTGRRVVGADPKGVLHFSDGEQVEADLVIGADGLHSRVRDSLQLARLKVGLGDGATRVLVPKHPNEAPFSTEHWSGQLRVGIAPCSEEYTYLFIIGPEKDRRATRVPLDKSYWKRNFPHLAQYFDAVVPEMSVHHRHEVVYCDSWVKGRVAIIGDAAHAQPPNFGQGAGVAICAAWELAECLAAEEDVRDALHDWEKTTRPRINMVQGLTTAYDILNYKWPRPLTPLRSKLFTAISKSSVLSKPWEFYWRGGRVEPRELGNYAIGDPRP
ncbi:FAD-dependent oxidoreductase [Leucobacter denitrificans]|uniref:FAD-dependent monooxygenase n=1 Tax=Leucobacter denitrificans TaxID=683042 RepID=A0A7G9S227_9MICO|nr:FAD-dependent monooxygenase [Leucobacter denitrificans]QNN61902.1 FAD-dependent monooxygenase [Leucobacter denitrificans]